MLMLQSPVIKDTRYPMLGVFLNQRETDPTYTVVKSTFDQFLPDLRPIIMSLLPLLLLLGVAMIGSVQGITDEKSEGKYNRHYEYWAAADAHWTRSKLATGGTKSAEKSGKLD
ncbi:hypothetical protein PoB_004934700 [Plakobranchus ocellatus]|uniref:Uncharacterized protein n=1 Tax=Plakobranchus ocellatus TaxID=259542 RepID=A0AAV4BU28_9GAST|nr:hypothetical protein PoB_004934700 [Plakobranchus ocellatus]